VYSTINPWAVLSRGRGVVAYPKWLAYWPALALYLVFIWLELFGAIRPLSLSIALLTYLAINTIGVGLFGGVAWFRSCEFFSVFFRLIGKMAPVRIVDGRMHLRAPFMGLLDEPAEDWSLVVFVL